MSYVVLIDIGGTFLKGAVSFDEDEGLVNVERRYGAELLMSKDGQAVLDPIKLANHVRVLCRDLISACGGSPRAIFVTGQMHGLVLTDKEGSPRSDVITWRDSLGSVLGNTIKSSVDEIRKKLSDEQIYDLGNELRDGLPISTLYARRTRGLEVRGLVPHSLLSFCVNSIAGNTRNPRMHVTDAAAHGFYRVHEKAWDEDALKKLDLYGMQLPIICEDLVPYGESSEYKCEVFCAVGDQQASLYGMQLSSDELSLNIATGSQVSIIADEPTGKAQVRPYFDGKFLSTVTHLPAGRALNVLISLVSELSELSADEIWSTVAQKTSSVEENELDVDLSFFRCTTGSSGHISNITENNMSIGQVFNAAVQTMAKNYVEAATRVTSGIPPVNLVISGGLAKRFPPLMAALENAFKNANRRVSESEDASLEGLSLLSQTLN